MAQQRASSTSSIFPASLLDTLKTYLLNEDPASYTDLENSQGENEMLYLRNSQPQGVLRSSKPERELNRLNKQLPVYDLDKSKMDLQRQSTKSSEVNFRGPFPGSDLDNMIPSTRTAGRASDHCEQGAPITDNSFNDSFSSVPTFLYTVCNYDSINSLALKFNTFPNMLKQLNGLSSDIIFPGQKISVPSPSSEPKSKNMNTVQAAKTNENTPSKKKFFRYPMKRITRFDGSVAGTTLMTSNAFMFRAHVSDRLVIQNGQCDYNASIPLDSICAVLMFDTFEQMLVNIQSNITLEGVSCKKCALLKQQLGISCSSACTLEEEQDMTIDSDSCDEFEHPESSDEESGCSPLEPDPEPQSLFLEPMEAQSSGVSSFELELSGTPGTYSPSCEHEFAGLDTQYSSKRRVNPFSDGEDGSNLIHSGYRSGADPLSTVGEAEGRLQRTDSDTSLATKAFFAKIDQETNQMQVLLDSANKHEYSVYLSLHTICCSRLHGKGSFEKEESEGYRKAHFWICLPDSEVASLVENLSSMCSQLRPAEEDSNCLLRSLPDHYTKLSDVILPDRKPTFLPREVDEDLLSEPFSGALNCPLGAPVLLNSDMMSELQPYLPSHIVGIDMLLTYSLKLHGMSLRSLYSKCLAYADLPCIMVIKDTKGYVFGAYLSHGVVESPKYYGSGETFLFRLLPESKSFFWQGENDYFMMGTSEYFTIGAGDGRFALYLDDMLQKGTSNRSLTFYNEVLSSTSSFSVLNVEVWSFTDEIIDEQHPDSLSSDKSRMSGQFRGEFYNSI